MNSLLKKYIKRPNFDEVSERSLSLIFKKKKKKKKIDIIIFFIS